MNKKQKYTNKNQLEILVARMKENTDIAQGFSQRAPGELTEFWENMSVRLNACGPPKKDASGWKKVWTDFKSGVKKKLCKNKQQLQGTGGGPFKRVPLSSIEEDVSCILNFSASIHGIPTINSFGNPNPTLNTDGVEIDEEIIEEIVEFDLEQPAVCIQEATCVNRNSSEQKFNVATGSSKLSHSKRRRVEHQNDLLKEQISVQKHLASKVTRTLEEIKKQNEENYKTMKDIRRSLSKISDSKIKQTKILQKQLEAQIKHKLELKEILKEKLEIKKKLLELELQRLNTT